MSTALKASLVVVVAAVALIYPFTIPKHSSSLSSLSPKFDGRDSGSRGDYFQTAPRGLWLYHQSWLPEEGTATRAAVLIVHGFGEHSTRYSQIAEFLADRGYAVYSMDHQGHGRSEGDRAHVEKFQHYVDDLWAFVQQHVLPKNKGKKLFLFGHSMGALLSLHLAKITPKTYAGVILSATPLVVDPNVVTPTAQKIAGFLSKHLPKLPLLGQSIKTADISRDPNVVRWYVEDELNYHGAFRARFLHEMIAAIQHAVKHLKSIYTPVLIVHSTKDAITPFYENFKKDLGSKDVTLVRPDIPGHEIIHDKEAGTNIDIAAWLDKHTAA